MLTVIGYGNPLRGDDGVGQALARLVGERVRGDRIRVIAAHQLTPELVAPVAESEAVVFVDARAGTRAGMLTCAPVEADEDGAAFTHHVTPGTLLAGARALYGTAPRGLLVTVEGVAFELEERLSPALDAALPWLADTVLALAIAQAG